MVRSISYSPDGRWLVSGSDDHSVIVWDSGSGQPVSSLGANLNYQTSVRWSADGQNLVTSGDDGLTRLWRSSDAGLNLTLPGPLTTQVTENSSSPAGDVSPGRSSILSPDGRWLAGSGDDGLVRIWPTNNLASPARWTLRQAGAGNGAIYTLNFSPDSQKLFSGGQAGYVSKFQLAAGDGGWQPAGSVAVGRGLHSLAISPEGDRLVTGSDDGQIRWWDADTLTPSRLPAASLTAHQGYIKELVFNADGTRLFSAGGDGRVLIWDTESRTVLNGAQPGGPIKAMALAADGQTIAAALSDGSITVYNSATNQTYLTIQGQGLTALGLAFAPDFTRTAAGIASRLAVVTLDGALQVWQLDLNFSDTANQLPKATAAQPIEQNSPFVQAGAASDHLTLNGQNVFLKGVNFYPRLASWSAMWQHWNGPQVAADLDQAASLGVNSLRVLVPYGTSYEWTGPDGSPDPVMLNELDQFIALAAQRHLRVLLTLFDFYGDFPNAGTSAEAANYRYLDALVTRYREDSVVLGWDIHNEPDNYNLWQRGENFQVLDWLERMAQHIRYLDPNHWVTVGFGNTDNLNRAGPDGISPLALEDTVALHAYDPTTIEAQVSAVRFDGANHLPVFLEEYGWPSGPTELTAQYTEAVQADHYRASLSAIAAANLDGGIAWNLWDTNYDTVVGLKPQSLQYFGLLRPDNSLKPLGGTFQSQSGHCTFNWRFHSAG